MFNAPITTMHVLNKQGLVEAFNPLAKEFDAAYTFHSFDVTEDGEDVICFHDGEQVIEVLIEECETPFYEAASRYIGHDVDEMIVLEIDDYLEQFMFRKK